MDSSEEEFFFVEEEYLTDEEDENITEDKFPAIKIDDQDFLEQPSNEDHKDLNASNTFFGIDEKECCAARCNRKIPQNVALTHRNNFLELKKEEQDLILLSHMVLLRRNKAMRKVKRVRPENNPKKKKCRLGMTYYFLGIPVCKRMYFFIHDVGKKRYENLTKHFDEVGVIARLHGNAKKTPDKDRICSPEEINYVTKFLTSFSETFAIPLSKRLPNFKNFQIMQLPSSETKISMYRRYCDACRMDGFHRVGKSLFLSLWNKYCPFIRIAKRSFGTKAKSKNRKLIA